MKRMKRCAGIAATLALTGLVLVPVEAPAGNVGVDLNVRVGTPPVPPPVIVPAPPVVVQPPVVVRPAPPVVIEEDVTFLYPEPLGFYVAVGIPYDLFYVGTTFYLYRDGGWLRAYRSGGPWVPVRHRDLPPGLRRHRIEKIRSWKNSEYQSYSRDRDHYRGRHFRKEKDEWKERRKAERQAMKEERKHEKWMDKQEEKESKWRDRHEDRGKHRD